MPILDPSQQEKIDRVLAFQRDVRRFGELLTQHEREVAEKGSERPRELEELRQSLLRRAGAIRELFTYVLPDAKPSNLWTRALYDPGSFHTRRLADYLTELIGLLEDNPSLLALPQARFAPSSTPGASAEIHIHGGNVNVAQTGTGRVFQSTKLGEAERCGEEEVGTDDPSRRAVAASWATLNPDEVRFSPAGFTLTCFPLNYGHAGVEARAEVGAVVKGDNLVVRLQGFERLEGGLEVWLTIENRGEKACRWFRGMLTAYASPRYEEISPAPNAAGVSWMVDIYPGEQFTCYDFFPFGPKVRGPKFLTCRSWDKELTFWWARGA